MESGGYEELGIAAALSRPWDYPTACDELSAMLCLGYSHLPKPLQFLVFQDTLLAFRILPDIQTGYGVAAANSLLQAAEAVLPKQKKAAAVSEFKHSVVAHKRRSKSHYDGALSCAKEAFNLRTKLLHIKFMYFHKKPYDVHLQTRDSVATETWPDFTRAHIIVDSFLSPWIVLRCYLESTFQVESIYESIGNGAEVEFMFRTGKEISHLQVLHSFEITFASSLDFSLKTSASLKSMLDASLKNYPMFLSYASV